MILQKLKNIYHLGQAASAAGINFKPADKLKIIGITGTDGKTTTVSLVYHLLKIAGYKTGMISTVGARINSDKLLTTGLHTTTPNPFLIQKLLREMVKMGCQYAVLEITSHALDQNRIFGIHIDTALITNINHEHLDYHQTIDNYLKAKLKIFNTCRLGIINIDDDLIKNKISFIKENNPRIKLITFGLKNEANFYIRNYNCAKKGSTFEVFKNKKKLFKGTSPLSGQYNLYNLLAAISIVNAFNLKNEIIKKGLSSFKPVQGRMQEVSLGQDFTVYVDFGHTPQAFEAILPMLRNLTKNRLIHVFGATGKRDKIKRPMMGKISGSICDLIYLTSEDTYGEDANQIISEIESGVKLTDKIKDKDYFIFPDRQTAIIKAINEAKKEDVVVITGVGHQTAINKGKMEIPWSEYEAVKKAINLRKQITKTLS